MYSPGLELSTQSVKIVVLDINNSEALYTCAFDYESTFPEYRTEGGVLANADPGIRHTSPFMLIESLDFAFKKLITDGIDLSLIKAVKADAMQHCTVYTDTAFSKKIRSLNPRKKLIEQLKSSITRKTSPIWEDRSPVKEAEYLTGSLKEHGGISGLTGNCTELRFPAAQILKWAGESPKEYENTSNIFLLSAFITSILAGKIAPVDTGDGWGTNLNSLNISDPSWSREALSAANSYLNSLGLDSSLDKKIGGIDHYDACSGKINPYFVKKYGVNPEAVILIGTGDNPATLLGCGGRAVVSLGSSYTVNGVMDQAVPSASGDYNIFGYAGKTAMALSVFTNGGKVHEHFLRKYILGPDKAGKIEKSDWAAYAEAAGSPQLTKDERLMFPYLLDESVPLRKKGFAGSVA